jgi:hypothetical protein
MKVYVHLDTLTDGSPWTTKAMFGTVPTAGDYPAIVGEADCHDWHWQAITTTDSIDAKQRFVRQYFYERNQPLFVVDDFRDVVNDSLLISRCLNTCRLFAAAGGRALWKDGRTFRDVSGTNNEFLCRTALEAL